MASGEQGRGGYAPQHHVPGHMSGPAQTPQEEVNPATGLPYGKSDPNQVQSATRQTAEATLGTYRGDGSDAMAPGNVSEQQIGEAVRGIINSNKLSANPALRAAAKRIEDAVNAGPPAG